MFFNADGSSNVNKMVKYPEEYKALKKEALDCERCHLRQQCKQVVIGEGSLENKIMFIGEGPGADEDRLGRPFVGRAGQLLDKMLAAVGIERKDVYISNIVKCRPPGNRQPTFSEADTCSPILISEIKIIDPKVIVPLGSVALKYLLDKDASITRQRGKWKNRGKYYFLPTFHPAYLLRNNNMKKNAWHDFKMIRKAVDRINEIEKQNA